MKNEIKIIIGIILFSFIPILVKFGESINIFQLSFSRVLIATVFIYFITKKTKINKKDYFSILLFGIFHVATILTSFYALKTLTVSLATILLFAANIYFYLISIFVFKEKITLKKSFALLLTIIGFFFIFSGKDILGPACFFEYIIATSSGIFMALVFSYGKFLRKKYDEKLLTLSQNFIGTILLIPFVFSVPFIFSFQNISIVMLIGIFCTAIPFLLIYNAFKKMEGTKISILMSLNIPLPIVLAGLIFLEVPLIAEMVGIGLIFISSILVSFRNSS